MFILCTKITYLDKHDKSSLMQFKRFRSGTLVSFFFLLKTFFLQKCVNYDPIQYYNCLKNPMPLDKAKKYIERSAKYRK